MSERTTSTTDQSETAADAAPTPPRAPRKRSAREVDAPLVLRSRAGEVLHISMPAVASTLRTTLGRLRLEQEFPGAIGVVSAIRGEGVTLISRSLAHVLANDWGVSVCVVDLNWRTPASWSATIDERPGMADVLRGTAPWHEAIAPTDEPALSILRAGRATASEIPVLASSATLADVLDDVRQRFDHVVVNLPALHGAPESLTLAAHTDAVALVVRQGVTHDSQVKVALDELAVVPVLGIVLNDYATKVPKFVMRLVAAS